MACLYSTSLPKFCVIDAQSCSIDLHPLLRMLPFLAHFLACTPASKELYLQAKRDIENANYETEKQYRKKCNEVANINREREREALHTKMEAKDHNEAEIERCNRLFDEQYQMVERLNEQIRKALNAENLKLIGRLNWHFVFVVLLLSLLVRP